MRFLLGEIMRIFKSAYYDQFHCIAGCCPDSCCKEWDVQVDSDTAAMYRALPGPLGDRLRQILVKDSQGDTVMSIENGRCPMWRADGLCRIQAELGEDALCMVCREFPRLRHDYGTFVELGLELSCPEAARLILTSPAAPFLEEEAGGIEDPEYDPEAMEVLLETRKTALSLLTDPRWTVQESLTLLLFYGHQAQALLDGGEAPAFEPELILQQAKQMAGPADPAPLLRFYSSLEILTDEWRSRLTVPAVPAEWSDLFRSLARYSVERYWLQAVADYDLVSRVKLVILACILVNTLGGDVISTAQLYSKEIENDADNVEAILDAAYTSPALTDARLLGLLMNGR